MRTIVWDVDDVLNDLTRCWFNQAWQPEHQAYGERDGGQADGRRPALTFEGITENPPHRLLGISRDEYLSSLDAFRLSSFSELRPREEVLSWFQNHGSDFRHIALTATPLKTAHLSAGWVAQHFGAWIRAVGFVPSRRSTDPDHTYDLDKAGFLRWFGAGDIFIDDSPSNVESISKMGIDTILFPRPWNNSPESISSVLDGLTKRRIA